MLSAYALYDCSCVVFGIVIAGLQVLLFQKAIRQTARKERNLKIGFVACWRHNLNETTKARGPLQRKDSLGLDLILSMPPTILYYLTLSFRHNRQPHLRVFQRCAGIDAQADQVALCENLLLLPGILADGRQSVP